MLMVLMTMAIIIVVGTSMLFVTLSSFSNSIADTQQTRAYNAALTVSGNVQQSMEEIILNKGDLITREGTYLYFTSNENFTGEEEIVDYTMVNGAKVQVVLTNVGASDGKLEDVLVDVIATCRQQTSKVSFTYHNETTTRNVTLEDTFGNAFVMNSDTGGTEKRDDLVFRRIEGDISINCWDEILDSAGNPVLDEDGNPKKKMTTRVYNPIVLEGLTGSIYANGDLIIGSHDNVIKVQGNIYCDGNLTIRGLDLGVNLPALYKKEYKKKFIKYSTIGNKTFAGFEILGTGEYKEHIGDGTVNEAMYLKYTTEAGDDDFLPLQIYDEVSHYTLLDLGITKFYTKVYTSGGQEINNGEGEVLKGADGRPLAIEIGEEPNPNYFGATMYYTPECNPEDMIMQYPQGGNIYCSGDIIFDRVNYGYNWVFDANVGGGSQLYQYHDLSVYDSTGKGKISLDGSYSENTAAKNKVYNATVGYNKSKIRGDIFCLGRMIIAPENLALTSKADKKYHDEAIVFTKMNGSIYDGSVFNGYLDANTIKTQVYSDDDTFFDRVKQLLGFNGNKWNYSIGNYTYSYSNNTRLEWNKKDDKLSTGSGYTSVEVYKNAIGSFIDEIKDGQTYADLRNLFNSIINNEKTDNGGNLYNNNYILNGDGYLTGMGTGDGEHYVLRPIEFSKNTNFYVYNWNYNTLIKTQANVSEEFRVTEIARQLNNSSLVQECRTDGTLKNTSTSTVNGVPYQAAVTVKFQTLDVNKVYANGNIEAVGVDAFGYDVKAGLNAKEIDTIGAFVSNEYQEISVLGIIMKINNCDEEDALEIIKEDYWKFDEDDDYYNAIGDIGVVIKDHETRTGTDREGIVLGYSVTYNVKVVATYYAQSVDYDKTDLAHSTAHVHYVLQNISDKQYSFVQYNSKYFLTKDQKGVLNKDKYWIATVYNEDDDEIEEVFNGKDFKGQDLNTISNEELKDCVKINNEILNNCFGGNENYYRDFICAYVRGDGQKFSSGFIFDLEEKRSQTIAQDPTQFNFAGSYNDTYYGWSYNPSKHYYQYQEDTKSYTVNYCIKPISDKSYDTVETSLKYDSVKDTIISLFKDIKQLALVSNSAVNSFDGIVQGHNLSVGNMITGDKTTAVGENSFNAGAFYDKNQGDGIYYGMYLRASNPRFTNVNKNASVLDVFHEIMSAGFVKIAVQKTESLTEASLREKINKGEVSVTEYDLFDASDKTNFEHPLKELKQDDCILKKLGEGVNGNYSWTSIDTLNSWASSGNSRGVTNFYTADTLAYIDGTLSTLGWVNDDIPNVWTYVRYKATIFNSNDRFYAIFQGDDSDKNVRVMRFRNTQNKNNSWTCDNTFGLDPLYCSYDEDGNPVGGDKGGVFVNLDIGGIRTQVDYTISDNIYLNFGGEFGGYDTEREDSVVFGASKDNGVIDSINQLNHTKRMNITIDATEHDVYVYINAPSKYNQVGAGEGAYVRNSDGTYTLVGEGKGDYSVTPGIEMRKCSWRIKGEHNAYIMLVGDTSINANAYKLSVNTSGGINSSVSDRSDTMLGTHFYSGNYTTYSGSYTITSEGKSSLKLAAKEISTVESGDMYIIGTMGNEMTLGRGGYINGFVYLPNGRYVNNSVGFLGILPNAYSSNNQATIVAQDVSIKGSNIGNLIFQAFDVAASAGGTGKDVNIDFIETGEVIVINKWEFGGYYYD